MQTSANGRLADVSLQLGSKRAPFEKSKSKACGIQIRLVALRPHHPSLGPSADVLAVGY